MPAKTKDPGATTRGGWGYTHAQTRERLKPLVLAGRVKCARCGLPILPGEPWDLGHVDGDKRRYSGPEHESCNRATMHRRPWMPPALDELPPERVGLELHDDRWKVAWLRGLRRPPADATWPRLMTVPHPLAVYSL